MSVTTTEHRFYVRFTVEVRHFVSRIWSGSNHLTHDYVSYLAQALKNFTTLGVTESTVFGYWAMFSLFPLVMLGTVLATFVLGQEGAKAQINAILDQFLPGGAGALIRDNIYLAISQRGPFGILGIIGLVYGSVGLFTNLQWDLSRIFRDKSQRPLPLQILVGVIMLIVLSALIIASIMASTLFSVIGSQIVGKESPLILIGAVIIPLAINVLIFVLMFRYVPQRDISLRAILPTALIGAVIWELGKNLFGWYVTNLANFGALYGSLGAVMGLLTWTYLTGCLVSICAEIAVATDDWQHRKPPAVALTPPSTNKPADELPDDHPNKVANTESA